MQQEAAPRLGGKSNSPTKRHLTALDGIRALAIIGVVIYHANPNWLPGGFLGVTVFFALSGYLITGGIVNELSRHNTLSFKTFYAKRLRRLWPLMIVVVAAVAILTALFATSLLEKMQPDAVPSLLFFDNIWYIFQNLSYFEAAGQPSPLTHFWYLGVIGQFYLVWPVILWAVWKVAPSKKVSRRTALVLMAASFIAMVLLFNPDGDPSRVYYGTDTRFAELMVGAWAALAFPIDGRGPFYKRLRGTILNNRNFTDVIGTVAFAAIITMMFLVDGSSAFLYRGGYLLTSVLCIVVVFAVRNHNSMLGRVLGVKPLQYLSSRSYGLYLWHYPLFLIMNPATRTTELPWWGWILEFAVIFGITELTYRFIELPTGSGQIGGFFRRVKSGEVSVPSIISSNKVKSTIVGVIVVAAAVLLVIGPVWDQNLREEHLRTTPLYQFQHADVSGELQRLIAKYTNSVDETTGASSLQVVLIGDSVALGTESEFYEIFPLGYMDAKVSRQAYLGASLYQQAIADGHTADAVVFALGTNGPLDEDTVRANIESVSNLPVYLVNNRMPDSYQDSNNEIIAKVAAEYPNVKVIDWYSESAGHDEWFWNDGTHLRPEGAEAYTLMLRRYIAGK